MQPLPEPRFRQRTRTSRRSIVWHDFLHRTVLRCAGLIPISRQHHTRSNGSDPLIRLRQEATDVLSDHVVLRELLPTSDQWHLHSLGGGYPHGAYKLKSQLIEHSGRGAVVHASSRPPLRFVVRRECDAPNRAGRVLDTGKRKKQAAEEARCGAAPGDDRSQHLAGGGYQPNVCRAYRGRRGLVRSRPVPTVDDVIAVGLRTTRTTPRRPRPSSKPGGLPTTTSCGRYWPLRATSTARFRVSRPFQLIGNFLFQEA